MQVRAKTEELCEMAEDHEDLISEAISDGIVTPGERCDIIGSARHLKTAIGVQACRNRIGIRMIRGGGIDRHFDGEVADYRRLLAEEKATNAVRAKVA